MNNLILDNPTVPSPFYRVTAKALIFDSQKRLLTVRNRHGDWELPGGGWEHDESFDEAVMRELQEELGVGSASIGRVVCTYRGMNQQRGFVTLRLAVPVSLLPGELKIGPDIAEACYMTQPEFMDVDFMAAEGEVREHADLIWQQC